MVFAILRYVVFAFVALAFVASLVTGAVKRHRGQDNGQWEDDPAPGTTRIRPGVGWGNGGSWH